MKSIPYLLLFASVLTSALTLNEEIAEENWWKKTIFYQIYPRSFKDTNGDGIGDLKGITSKLQYLSDTGIGATWLSPIFESPMVDFGYDISNFTAIQDEYGTMEDFNELMIKAKQLGIKVILDLVPNHTSNQCEWFLKSINREPGFEDFYVWHDGRRNDDGELIPPNNWVSVFYGPAWTWNDIRQQFYLHQFTKEQPDLNFRNPLVVEAMEDVMKFWLEKGVNGFRIDAVNHLFEVDDFADEPETGLVTDPNYYDFTHHYYTKDLPESVQIIYKWRQLLDNWSLMNGGDIRILMTEVYANITTTIEYYGSEITNEPGAQIPFNFLMITDVHTNSNARDVLFNIHKWLSYMPLEKTANWVLGNHDRSRIGSRFGTNRIDALNILLLTLPGVAVTYNGEEIGMVDNDDISWEDTKDPAARNTNPEIFRKFSRDPVRTPYQWDDSLNAGFSIGPTTWLPVNQNYRSLNLREQQETTQRSHYKLYKQIVELRLHRTMLYGNFNPLALNKYVLAYTRTLSGSDTFVIVINFSNIPQNVNLKVFDSLSDDLLIIAVSIDSMLKIGSVLKTESIALGANDAIILKSIQSELLRDITKFLSKSINHKSIIQILLNVSTVVTGAYLVHKFYK